LGCLLRHHGHDSFLISLSVAGAIRLRTMTWRFISNLG
jgi:hypothetical protein